MHTPTDDRKNAHDSAGDDVIPDCPGRMQRKHKRRDNHPDAQQDIHPAVPNSASLRRTNSLFVHDYFLSQF